MKFILRTNEYKEINLPTIQKSDHCPFCKSSEEILLLSTEKSGYRIFCRECGCYGPSGDGPEEAILNWNTRLGVKNAQNKNTKNHKS